jgi:hypothetical protein
MKLNLQQGSPEWLQYRYDCVTATDFSVIAASLGLCANIFNKSISQLISDKINATQVKDNKFFAMGRQFEERILQSVHFIEIASSEVFAYDKNPRIMASLDARDLITQTAIEIKSTRKGEDKLRELIDYYQFQVMHQCHCANLIQGLLLIGMVDDLGEIIKLEKIKINPMHIMSKSDWLSHCEQFLVKLDDAKTIPDNTAEIWSKYQKILATISTLTNEKDLMREELINLYPNGTYFKEFSLTKQNSTTVKYAQIIKDQNIEIEDKYKTNITKYILKGN